MSDGPAQCPVSRDKQQWLEHSMYWMGRQFGAEVCYRDPTLPTADFISAASYPASPEGIEAIVARLCELMLIERERVRLELSDGSAEAGKKDRHTVGHFRVVDGKPMIAALSWAGRTASG